MKAIPGASDGRPAKAISKAETTLFSRDENGAGIRMFEGVGFGLRTTPVLLMTTPGFGWTSKTE